MADLTLDEFKDIPEELLKRLLREEEKRLFYIQPPQAPMNATFQKKRSPSNIQLNASLLETKNRSIRSFT